MSERFGAFELTPIWQRLLQSAQSAPHNWFGQQWAQIVRKLMLRCLDMPIDVAVGPVRLRAFLHDNNSEKKFVFMPWRFDACERQLLAEVLPCDGVFVDIGANVGLYSIAAAHCLREQGRVIAFEPNPPARARLTFNLDASLVNQVGKPRVEILATGVSDQPGHFRLYLDANNLGSSSLLADGSTQQFVEIECHPLAAQLQALQVTRIDALKIDIEGAEDRALVPFFRDAEPRLWPKLIIIENSQHKWQTDLYVLFAQLGYQVQFQNRMNSVFVKK